MDSKVINDKKFNKADTKDKIVYHPNYGIISSYFIGGEDRTVNYKLMKNKVRFILSVLLIALTLGSVKSQNIVNESIARKIGTNFISHNSNRTNETALNKLFFLLPIQEIV